MKAFRPACRRPARAVLAGVGFSRYLHDSPVLRCTQDRQPHSGRRPNGCPRGHPVFEPVSSSTHAPRQLKYPLCRGHFDWRKGWDSNPRETYASAGFQDRCIRPLCHPSTSCNLNLCRFWLRHNLPAAGGLSQDKTVQLAQYAITARNFRRLHASRELYPYLSDGIFVSLTRITCRIAPHFTWRNEVGTGQSIETLCCIR